ncbi:MAG: ABC transporter ATP-binding protein [Desulfurococcaceae archaeon]|nr:MAG: ABC transporter ATP-binding protein [Desulfurococcaceae archaeon]
MTLLEVKSITKRFGGILALRNVSFKIDKGELVAIIGPNGSGKTTLFNVISGVYKPDTGSIFFEGVDITGYPSYKRARIGIGRSFQIPRPFPGLSVRESVAVGALFGAAGKGLSVEEALRIADEVLRDVGLYDKRFELAGKLTGPEKKLLELARALAMKPKLLLLDEVMAGMPPAEIDRLSKIIRDVAGNNIATLSLVEHVMRAVTKIAERAIVLHRGEIVLEGSVEEVLMSEKLKEIYLGVGVVA